MNEEAMNDHASSNTADEMLADLDLGEAEATQVRTLLGEVAGLAHEVPEPSDAVRVLLGGAIPLRPRHRVGVIAAAVSALALGGVSAAAATNRLPDPVQKVVADATGGVVPHPNKPSNPPYDAPGHVINKPKPTKTPKPKPTTAPRPLTTNAPGQIQKLTKPDPTASGAAHPADPGSHGRAQNDSNVSGDGRVQTDSVDKVQSDNDEAGDDDSGSRKGKSD